MKLEWRPLEWNWNEDRWNETGMKATGMKLEWRPLGWNWNEGRWNETGMKAAGMKLEWRLLECLLKKKYSGVYDYHYVCQRFFDPFQAVHTIKCRTVSIATIQWPLMYSENDDNTPVLHNYYTVVPWELFQHVKLEWSIDIAYLALNRMFLAITSSAVYLAQP